MQPLDLGRGDVTRLALGVHPAKKEHLLPVAVADPGGFVFHVEHVHLLGDLALGLGKGAGQVVWGEGLVQWLDPGVGNESGQLLGGKRLAVAVERGVIGEGRAVVQPQGDGNLRRAFFSRAVVKDLSNHLAKGERMDFHFNEDIIAKLADAGDSLAGDIP